VLLTGSLCLEHSRLKGLPTAWTEYRISKALTMTIRTLCKTHYLPAYLLTIPCITPDKTDQEKASAVLKMAGEAMGGYLSAESACGRKALKPMG
jgi:hypothetical protein